MPASQRRIAFVVAGAVCYAALVVAVLVEAPALVAVVERLPRFLGAIIVMVIVLDRRSATSRERNDVVELKERGGGAAAVRPYERAAIAGPSRVAATSAHSRILSRTFSR